MVAKLAGATGNTVWAKGFGDGNAQAAYGVTIDASGNVVVSGDFKGTANFGAGAVTAPAGGSVFMVKYNSAGTYLWGNVFGTSDGGGIGSRSITTDPSGNYLLTGFVTAAEDFGKGFLLGTTMQTYICKYNTSGAAIWTKRVGPGSCSGLAVSSDSAGNVLSSGTFTGNPGNVDFGGGSMTSPSLAYDGYLVKYAP